MTDLVDPPRLMEADGVPAGLQSLLEQARGDVLGADAVSRVAAGVQAQLGGSGTPTDGSASPPTGDGSAAGSSVVPSSPAGKLGAGVIVAALVGGGLWLASDRADEPTAVASSQATTVAASAAPDRPATGGERTAAATTDEALEVPPATTTGSSSPGTTALRHGNPAPSASAAPPSKPSQADLVAEHQLLRSARAALAQNPRRAYGLTQEHKRRFPQGMLTQEREVIAIEALARMGDSQAADQRADQFSKDYPDSPHRDRVDGATGGQ